MDLEVGTCEQPESKTPLLTDHFLLNLGVPECHRNYGFSLRVLHLYIAINITPSHWLKEPNHLDIL